MNAVERRQDARATADCGRAAQLRQARRLPRGAHARRRRGRGRALRSLRRGAGGLADQGLPVESRSLAADRRAPEDDRRRPPAPQRRGAARSNCGFSPRSSAAASETEIPDQRLALMFACAHPAIEAGIRAPLMLQVVLGLDAKTIASAFLMSPAAMGKRLVRAKDKIRQAGIPFSIPERERAPRPARRRARCDLRRLRGRLDRSGRHRRRPARSHRRSDLSRPSSSPNCCRSSRRRSACSP